MHQTSMQQYANEKIRNARRTAEIQREVDKARSREGSEGATAKSLQAALGSWLLNIIKIRPSKSQRQARISETS